MAESQQADGPSAPAPNLLAHLEQAFDWSEGQALDALGAYLMSTEAGRTLGRELSVCSRNRRAA
jgi:hypothetical protein